jgi:hypothetical protein
MASTQQAIGKSHHWLRTFGGLGIVCAVYAIMTPDVWLKIGMGWTAVAFLGIAGAYGGIGPKALLKRPDGTLLPVSYLLFAPYHLFSLLSYWLVRRGGRFQAFSVIEPGLLLGCRLTPADAPGLRDYGVTAVFDLTAEFTEPAFLRRAPHYRCIPVLDATPPTLAELQDGVAWLQEMRAVGNTVYVHCALGRGRSALFVAAYLLASGAVQTPDEAIAHLAKRRPGIRLHPSQNERLREFAG